MPKKDKSESGKAKFETTKKWDPKDQWHPGLEKDKSASEKTKFETTKKWDPKDQWHPGLENATDEKSHTTSSPAAPSTRRSQTQEGPSYLRSTVSSRRREEENKANLNKKRTKPPQSKSQK